MSEKIKLLELDIDSDSVVKRAAEARKSLEQIKNESKDLKKVLDEQNDLLKESTERLADLEKQGKENSEEYEIELALHRQLNESITNQNELYEKSLSNQRNIQKEYNMSKRVLDAYNKTLQEQFDIITETDGSRNQLMQALSHNRKIYSDLTEDQRENSEVGKQLLKLINEQDVAYKEVSMSMGITQVNVGNYTESVVSAIDKLKSGDIQGFTDDVKNMGSEWIATSKSISASIMSMPLIGWLAAVAVGIGLVANEFIKYNNELQKSNVLTNQITKLEGDALDMATLRARTFRDKFNYEEQESLESAAALVQQYKISYTEAFDVIQEGAIRGGMANQEYLESIKEYSTFFAQAGYSAQEFIALINAGADLKIFKDKLVDSIKEFRISITEQTPATRTALVNAFGQPFTDELLKRVSEGKTTTKQALEEVAKESEKYQLTNKQQAQLTADLFRGAGEDAGGVEKVLKAVAIAQTDWNKPLSETQALVAKQIGLMNDLEIAQHNALKSDEYLALKNTAIEVWTEVKIFWYNWLASIQVQFTFTKSIFMSLIDYGKQFHISIGTMVIAVGKDIINLASAFSELGSIIKSAFNLDYEGVESGFNRLKDKILNSLSNTRNAVSNEVKKIGNIVTTNYNEAIENNKNRANQQRIEDAKNEKPTNNFDGSEDRKKQAEKDAKEQERLRKQKEAEEKKATEELLKIARDNAKAKIDILKTELDAYIRTNKSKIDNQTFVTKTLIDLEEQRLKAILDKKNEVLEKEKNLELSNKELTEEQKKSIEAKYRDESQKASEEFEASKKEIADRYKEQLQQTEDFRKLEQHKKDLDDLETQGASEFELKQSQLDFEYETNQERKTIQKELDDLAKQEQDAETIQRKTDLEMALNNIEIEYAQANTTIAEEKENAKLSMAGQAAGAISNIAGKQTAVGKAAAVAETSISTYMSATKAYSSLSGIPIVGPALGAVAAGLAIASGLANVAKIVGVKVPDGASSGLSALSNLTVSGGKQFSGKKAEKGILLKGNSHANGGINLYDDSGNHVVEAEGDELLAVINKRSTGLLSKLSNINVLGGGIPLTHQVTHAASGGLVGGSTRVDNTVIVDISDQIGDTVAGAVYNGVQQGMKDLSDDRNVALDAQY